jgi:hypothetical protein
MQIQGYDNRFIDIAELRKKGKSEAYIAGVKDGYRGERECRPQKPKAPELQMRRFGEGRFEVYGNTYEYKDHFKRLGGKWNSSNKTWVFSAEQLIALKADQQLNADMDLWSGIPDHEPEMMEQALVEYQLQLNEYGEGYVEGQIKACRQPIPKVSYGRRR